ncbi:MAG: HEAT repeat domain-containing protein [Pseudomonadota bacterium]
MPRPPQPDLVDDSTQTRKQVQTFVQALDKALRAQRLYGGRSSAFVVKLLEHLEREVSDLLTRGPVALGVRSLGFTLQGKPLMGEDAQEPQIPWAFRLFCDGIREITFQQNLRWEELLDFLDILATNPRTAEDDLVTMLWERDFDGIHYYAADTFAAGLEVDENGELVLARTKRVADDTGAGVESVALAPDDIRLLSGEGHLNWLGLSRAPSRSGGAHAWQAARLKSSLQDVQDLPRFLRLGLRIAADEPDDTSLALLADQLSAHIARRDQEGVVSFMKALAEIAPGAGAAGARVVAVVLAEERLPALAEALAEAGEELTSTPARLLRTGAQEPLSRLLFLLPACPFQQALEAALMSAGADLTPLYAERLGAKDPELVSASIQALGRIGSVPAVQALIGVLGHPSSQRRRAALEALAEAYHPVAKAAILRCLDDPLAANRMLALRILRAVNDPVAARAVVAAMRQPSFEKRDMDEVSAWYRSLAGTPQAVSLAFLGEQLARRNLLRNRTVMAHQVLAARALGEIPGPEARGILEQALGRGGLPAQVKHAVSTALHAHRGAAHD